jgi:ATP-dependent helicase/nuclease subunit A
MAGPTPAQKLAIEASGNVLVVAGAGAGKTRTLVDRCLAWLLDESQKGSIEQVLMVTFTEAAATEMRKRLRAELEKKKAAGAREALNEQLALLETANICTLHSFCYRLIREHFYELDLDPQLSVLPEEQSRLMMSEALDRILERAYEGTSDDAIRIRGFIQNFSRGWDKPVRDAILTIHRYRQSLRDPDAWLTSQRAAFEQSQPTQWHNWYFEAVLDWQKRWLPILRQQPEVNTFCGRCVRALETLGKDGKNLSEICKTLSEILTEWKGKRGDLKKPKSIEPMFDEAEFLQSLCPTDKEDPLKQDWDWLRNSMRCLLDLTQQFQTEYSRAKTEMGAVDYNDLEQLSLRLLWNGNNPTNVAREWREKFRLVFVDEFQDINSAQEAIIYALSNDNRFLVGDIKQSIYRFRLADPRIFLKYHEDWRKQSDGKVIPLSDNFRSHEAILNFVNALFGVIMKKELGDVSYDAEACLQFGAREERPHLAANPEEQPPVELLLRRNGGNDDTEETEPSNETFSEAEREAQLIAARLKELQAQGNPWSDMVVLMRSPRPKVETYVKEFTRMGVPLVATRGGFFDSLEIRDLLDFLKLLDNPLQDIPLLGVLRSPMVGMSPEDLVAIRLVKPDGQFWSALLGWHKAIGRDEGDLFTKVDTFITRYKKWRRMARQTSLSHTLEQILNDTHFVDLLHAQDRTVQKRANVERLLQLSRQFDVFQREGLYRFLKFVDAQLENEIDAEPAAPPETNAVRLMSIHQSKGLEFPVVVVADLGKRFNFRDGKVDIILSEKFGLCGKVKPPTSRRSYPSLVHWLAQRQQRLDTLGEELRLLYVAMTRAEHRLILVGTASKTKLDGGWSEWAGRGLSATELSESTSALDWIGSWLAMRHTDFNQGEDGLLTWKICDDVDIAEPSAKTRTDAVELPADALENLRARLDWTYPHIPATTRSAKTTVSALRKELRDDEAKPFLKFDRVIKTARATTGVKKLSAAEIGSAHHAFLEQVQLHCIEDVASLRKEGERLVANGFLSDDEIACIDFEHLAQFWQSPVAREIICNHQLVRRELPFTARFSAKDFGDINLEFAPPDGEFVIVQGVVDLAVISPDQIWILDFKTDHAKESDLGEKVAEYRPQLALYARALERIYNRQVTKRWLHFLSVGKTVAV